MASAVSLSPMARVVLLLVIATLASDWRRQLRAPQPRPSLSQQLSEDVRNMGELVLDEDGSVIGRERAVEMVASSINALQPPKVEPPPPTTLPPSVLPPSLRPEEKVQQAGQPQPWLAVAAACCIALAALLPFSAAAADAPAVAESATQQEVAGVVMSKAQVETVLSPIAVTAIVNAEGQPYMIDSERGSNLGFFYLEPSDALRDLQARGPARRPAAAPPVSSCVASPRLP